MKIASLRHPGRYARRYSEISAVFLKHGFGFAIDRLKPEMRSPFRRLRPQQQSTPPLPHEDLAVHFRQALEELGPTFVKLGQVLSTRPDLLPPPYIVELSKLQDTVPPVSWEIIHGVITQELGRPPEEVFQDIEEQPMAAASLSQVYGARLFDGTEVVLKVQRPGIQQIIAADLEILSSVATAAQATPLGQMYDFVAITKEFGVSLRDELDYAAEGRNADRFRVNFAHDAHLYVPRVYWEHSTARLLVMERIHGIKIDDVAALDAAGYDRHQIALNSTNIIVKEVLEDGFFHADPHPGNLVVRPGNVIGAMDFGMVGYLSDSERLDLLRLYLVTADMDAEGMVDQFIRMGAAGSRVDRQGLAREIDRLLSKYSTVEIKDVHARDVAEELTQVAYRHHLRLPTDLWLLAKTLGIMEGIGLKLDPTLDMFSVFESYARRLSWRLLMPRRTWGPELLRQAADWSEFLGKLPHSASHLLRQAESGELLQFSLKDTEPIMARLDRLATRLSLSVLVAALIVSLALIVPATTNGTSIHLPLAVSFGAAAALGLWLFISILRGTR